MSREKRPTEVVPAPRPAFHTKAVRAEGPSAVNALGPYMNMWIGYPHYSMLSR
jgi:hypothetical protein